MFAYARGPQGWRHSPIGQADHNALAACQADGENGSQGGASADGSQGGASADGYQDDHDSVDPSILEDISDDYHAATINADEPLSR